MTENRVSKQVPARIEIGLAFADLLMMQLCLFVAILVFHNLRSIKNDFSDTLEYFYGLPNLAITAYWMAMLQLSRLAKPLFPRNLYGDILRVFNVVSLGIILMLFAMADFSDPNSFFSTSKILIFLYWFVLIVTLSFNRFVFARTLYSQAAVDADTIATPLMLPRKLIIVLGDLLVIATGYYLSFMIRFEGDVSQEYFASYKASLPVVIILRFSMFLYFRLYSGYYRYASISDLSQIIKAVTAGSILIAIPSYFFGYASIPRGVFVIDWLIMIVLLGGSRFLLRAGREMLPALWGSGKRTFIIGAGSAGEMI